MTTRQCSTRNRLVYTLTWCAIFIVVLEGRCSVSAFTPANIQRRAVLPTAFRTTYNSLQMSEKGPEEGVVELGSTATKEEEDDDDAVSPAMQAMAAPFLSQGEVLDKESLNPDLSDAKQTRVIIYMIISLIPVLFLIPLMLASRDLIPLDALPPVDM